jgi:hypothetical protein
MESRIFHTIYHKIIQKIKKPFIGTILNDLFLTSMTCSTFIMFCTNVFEESSWGIFSNSSTFVEVNHSSHASHMSFLVTITSFDKSF